MRARAKAELISERLRGGEPGEALRRDPELRDIGAIASILETVSRSEPLPSPEAARRMKARVMECHRRVLAGEKARERDPSRAVSTLEPRRVSYSALAAAAVLAAVLVVTLVVVTAPENPLVPPPMAVAVGEAWVSATGRVDVLSPGGEWTSLETPLKLAEGDVVRTPQGVRAEVAFGGGNLLRLDYASEVELSRVSAEGIAVALRGGQGYFRAHEGTAYTVSGGRLVVEARGTAFNLDLRGAGAELLSLAGEVEAYLQGRENDRVRLRSGRMLRLPSEPGEEGLAAWVLDIPPERLRDEWLLWNRDLDASRGYDLGVLEGVQEEETVTDEGFRERIPEKEEEQGDKEGETEGVKPSVALRGELGEKEVVLSWEVTAGEAQGFELLRATGRDPVYPGDALVRLGSEVHAFTDRQVQGGSTYVYRIAVPYGDDVTYSNQVVVDVPAEAKPVITLNGGVVDGGGGVPAIRLVWHVEGAPQADFYALVRAEMGAAPVYPPAPGMPIISFQPAGADYAYLDRELYMGYTYAYRVFAIRDGAIVLDSNIVSVYVDTSSIMSR